MEMTYGVISHPVFLSPGDLDTTYRLWLMWFERATSIGSAVKPTPVPPPGSGVAALVNDYASGFPSPPNGGGLPGGGGFSIWGIFLAIAAFVEWLVESLLYTIEWIITHAFDILALPFVEAIGLMKWLLYQVQKGIWEIYDNLRFGLVLGGYLFPEQRDLAKNPWGSALLNTSHVSLTGGSSANFNLFPRKQENHGLGGPTEHHLIYPGTLQELQHAEPMPKPFHGQWPEVFIDAWHAYDPFIEHLYACTHPYGPGLDATHTVDQQTWTTPQFGSALQFSARLIAERLEKLPNFNLDGDRGYGWKTWRATGLDPNDSDPDERLETSNPVDVTYTDA